MDLVRKVKMNSKLKGLPKVYYFNLDSDTERKEFMEDQFHRYGIAYERVSQSRFVGDNIKKWSRKFEDSKAILKMESSIPGMFIYPANFLSHMEFMKTWLRESSDEYLMVMEDDYDLSLIEYWHFNWRYFISKLPADWDAVKLNDDNSDKIRFFLRPVEKGGFSNFGAMVFKREFVQRLIFSYYSRQGKIKSFEKRSMNNWKVSSNTPSRYSVDNALVEFGSVYMAPLITTEASFCADPDDRIRENSSRDIFEPIQRACHHWWKNERDLFTLDDFFQYSKPNDEDMTIYLEPQIR